MNTVSKKIVNSAGGQQDKEKSGGSPAVKEAAGQQEDAISPAGGTQAIDGQRHG